MAETQQVIHQLAIHLTGGQTVRIQFDAEKPSVFNLQIHAFLQTLIDKNKQKGNFFFEGDQVVFVRIPDVIAAEVESFVLDDPQTTVSSPENASDQDGNSPLTDDSGPSEMAEQCCCKQSDLP